MKDKEPQCSPYVMSDDYDARDLKEMPEADMCKCPKCDRGIPPDFSESVQFKCAHCGAVLEAIPEFDPDEDPEEPMYDEWNHPGKICIVPDYAIKQ